MRIEAAIFMDHNDAGQFRRRLRSRVGAGWPDKIPFDASVPVRRWNGFVAGFDPVIGLGYLLPHGIVRHQRLNERRCRQTANRKFLYALHKRTAADDAVNKQVIKFYRLAWNLGFGWLHWWAPFLKKNITFRRESRAGNLRNHRQPYGAWVIGRTDHKLRGFHIVRRFGEEDIGDVGLRI